MSFSDQLIAWQRQHGRHGLPWQQTRDPYRVWLSEIMLQQTQVTAVIPYYQQFLASFPDVFALARAPQQDVMAHWAGLGYYARARNLHRCAQMIVEQFGGVFPQEARILNTLPGIGPSTAAAIAAFTQGERTSILDGNVKRVLARYRAIAGDPAKKETERQLWQVANELLPTTSALKKDPQGMGTYTQGLMDLGSMICTRSSPKCGLCPVQPSCQAHAQGLTDVLPTPRARKTIPERNTTMLIIEHDQHLLLEQRPQKGIWGGLWSLPEKEEGWPGAQPLNMLPDSIPLTSLVRLAGFQHVFTHFRLNIQPIALRMPGKKQPKLSWLDTPGALSWVPVSQIHEYGLPKPVKTLLDGWLDQPQS